MKRDYKFWVVLAVVVLFLVFVWPTPFELRTESYRGLLGDDPPRDRTVRYNRFTGKRAG